MYISLGDRQIPFRPWKPELGQVFSTDFGMDTETTLIQDECPWITPAYVLGAACDGEHGYFVQREHVLPFLQAHVGIPAIFHNAPFDLEVLQLVAGPEIDVYDAVDRNQVWDTNLLHRLLMLGTEGHTAWGKNQSTLETCAGTYLGCELPKDTCDTAGDPVRTSYAKWLGRPPAEIEPVYLDYLGKDALATVLVYQQLRQELADLLAITTQAFGYISQSWLDEQIERWGPQTHHTQLKAAIVLRAITANGLHIDLAALETLRPGLETKREELLTVLRGYGYLPGQEGNAKTLQAILARLEREQPELVLPRTATGKIGTSEEALEELRGNPFVDALLEFKAVDKLLTTYLGKLSKGVLHPKFNPLLESGRTSSFGDINAQNLPRDERVRACFVPSPGHAFVDADYKTLELATLGQSVETIFGINSRMGHLINDGIDLHRVLAAKMTGKQESDVTKDERQKAKAINFGKPGGMGTRGLIRYAKASYGVLMSEEEAQDIETAWFELFPEMEKYLNHRIDCGLELAFLLDLTPNAYHEATGSKRFSWAEDGDEPCGVLGGMCLKSVREDQPSTNNGRVYDPAEIEFFWDRLNDALDELPASTHEAIRRRKPSIELGNKLRWFVGLAPVSTITGRLRANAGYCQQRNTPFQGLAADGAKLALWKLWRAGFRIINFIHDEVVVEVPIAQDNPNQAERICELMREAMREVVPNVAIEVEYGITDRWAKPGSTLMGKDRPISKTSNAKDGEHAPLAA